MTPRKITTAAVSATVLASLLTPAAAAASTSPAHVPNAGETTAAALACGPGRVFLDGIRALDVLEEGERDEVYILNEKGVKIWPRTAPYVSMAKGQRVEVDKCVRVGATLRLWDDDGPLNPDDFMGLTKILSESTFNHVFDNRASRYRLGVIA
ncbi:hypothetical protein HII36_11530 [Nonomuraea sp. NN258]|uniref:hypothetical protein n=1 Tax=Nonomuraea antri TaxID=2730852 RepID=UPI00156A69F1|nr:hypothetical protein [Nonomuraea antri]NRQ32465.1 hypothetical protein [Nonomuraea antri]